MFSSRINFRKKLARARVLWLLPMLSVVFTLPSSGLSDAGLPPEMLDSMTDDFSLQCQRVGGMIAVGYRCQCFRAPTRATQVASSFFSINPFQKTCAGTDVAADEAKIRQACTYVQSSRRIMNEDPMVRQIVEILGTRGLLTDQVLQAVMTNGVQAQAAFLALRSQLPRAAAIFADARAAATAEAIGAARTGLTAALVPQTVRELWGTIQEIRAESQAARNLAPGSAATAAPEAPAREPRAGVFGRIQDMQERFQEQRAELRQTRSLGWRGNLALVGSQLSGQARASWSVIRDRRTYSALATTGRDLGRTAVYGLGLGAAVAYVEYETGIQFSNFPSLAWQNTFGARTASAATITGIIENLPHVVLSGVPTHFANDNYCREFNRVSSSVGKYTTIGVFIEYLSRASNATRMRSAAEQTSQIISQEPPVSLAVGAP